MKRWIMRILAVLVLAGLVAGGAAWYRGRDAKQVEYRFATVTRGDVTATISATGTLEPEQLIDIGAQVAGQIVEFGKALDGKPVDYNSKVAQGMVLARIDDTTYKADVQSAKAQLQQANAGVERAQADLATANAKLDQARNDWNRAQKLGPSEALAQQAYDQYKATYETAKANIGIAQAEIDQAKATVIQSQAALERTQRNLQYCTISSPVDGVIIDRRVNIGQTVVASLNAPSLFLIAQDLRRMEIWTSVNEADIGNIHTGQKVTFTVDTFPYRKFHGTVDKVRLNATMTQNVVTYTVEVVADNSDELLLPYLTASVSFEVSQRKDVLLVPNAALRWSPSDLRTIVPDARDEFAATNAPTGNTTSGGARRETRDGQGGGGSRDGAEAGPSTSPAGIAHPATPSHQQRGILWIQEGNFVRPIHVRLGVTDGINTEVISDQLTEGQQVVQNEAVPGADAGDDARNPFAPQFRRRR